MNKTILLLWLLTFVLLVVQLATAYPQLPDRVISHINMHGRPDGEATKGSFFSAMAMAIVAVNIWPPVVSTIMRKAPAGMINLPNKEYWLGDASRRAQAAGKTAELLAAVMALVNICFMIAVQAVIDLNLMGEIRIPMWTVVVPIAASVILVPILAIRSFRVPADRRDGTSA